MEASIVLDGDRNGCRGIMRPIFSNPHYSVTVKVVFYFSRKVSFLGVHDNFISTLGKANKTLNLEIGVNKTRCIPEM